MSQTHLFRLCCKESYSSPTYPHTSPTPKPTQILLTKNRQLFRTDRGAFWMGRHAYGYVYFPFTRFTRRLLDPFMHTRTLYHGLHKSGMTRNEFVIQDMAMPAKRIGEFVRWLDTDIGETPWGGEGGGGGLGGVWPRWLCPLKKEVGREGRGFSPYLVEGGEEEKDEDDWLLNIGIWGPTPKQASSLEINRRLERKLKELDGFKWLYAQTYYTEEEFWEVYDRKGYDELRKKWKAEGLPSVYEKVGPRKEVLEEIAGRKRKLGWYEWIWENVWPLKGVYGAASALKGGDYLRRPKAQ